MKTVDLTGRVIDCITIIKKANTKYKNRQIEWDCICKCGTLFKRTTARLLSVKCKIKSCGCQNWKSHHNNTKYKNAQEASYNSLINRYIQKSAARKLSFELTREECILLFNSNCHYCDCVPDNSHNVYSSKGGKIRTLHTTRAEDAWIKYNGIDRVDSDLPYTLSNVVPACSKCNYAKLALTTEEFYSWLRKVYEHAKNCGHI